MTSLITSESVQAFLAERLALLQSVQAAAVTAFHAGTPAALYALPQDAVATAVGALLAAQLLLLLATRGGRSLVVKTVDTILAMALLAAILVIVAGLPVGKCTYDWGLSGIGAHNLFVSILDSWPRRPSPTPAQLCSTYRTRRLCFWGPLSCSLRRIRPW